jgi:tetratricopeptide (TPR) repeat protein
VGRKPLFLTLVISAMVASSPAWSQATTHGEQSPAIVSQGSVTVTYGLTPEQVRELTKAAVAGATGPLSTQLVEVSSKLGVTQAAALTLLRVLGEQNEPLERLPEKLGEITTRYKQAVERLEAIDVQDDPVTRSLVEQAQTAIKDGRLAEADGLLSQAEQADIAAAHQAQQFAGQAQAAADQRLLQAAAASASRGDIAMTELRYPDAAEHFQQAVDLVPVGHPDERGRYLLAKANALTTQGEERGDNPALIGAIATFQLALLENTRQRVPLEWAGTQLDLGVALVTLGERESGTEHLQQAIDAFNSALLENTPRRVPLDWAVTQGNLAFALEQLGKRTRRTDLLVQALTRMQDAAGVYRTNNVTGRLPAADAFIDRLQTELASAQSAKQTTPR